MTDLKEVLSVVAATRFEGRCCILASLTIRDVLRALGFPAEVKSVALQVTARVGDTPLHQLGVGMNALLGEPYEGEDWDGHLIVTTADLLIDPTFYNVRRQAWEWTPNVAVVRRANGHNVLKVSKTSKLRILGAMLVDNGDYRFEAIWAANSMNRRWRNAPDISPDRRIGMVAEIVRGFQQ